MAEIVLTLAQLGLLGFTIAMAMDPETRTPRCRSLSIVGGLIVQATALNALGLCGPAISTALNAVTWTFIVWRRAA